jgi:nicotinate-nucleotide adenylyltransferase
MAEPGWTGLLGGTFNPVHEGHLALAREARRAFGLEEVWLIPGAVPPHKTMDGLASNADRLAMLRLAAADEPGGWLKVSDIEMRLPPPSWTLRTLVALRAEHPGRRFAFIIGGDTLAQLHTWHEPLRVLELARFVTLARAGYGKPEPAGIRLPPPWPERLLADYREAALPDVSSSGIRARLARGESIDGLVPEPAILYIRAHQVYP